jgi:putative transposase
MRIQSLNHSTYQHQYHIVWGTKYRYKYLKEYVKAELLECLYNVVKEKYPTLHIYAINVDKDHLHMQIEIPPNIAVAKAVQALKSATSFHLKKKFKFIKKMYLEHDGIWSVGYFSSTIGMNEEQIRKYINRQGQNDLPKTIGFEFS